MKKSLVYVKKYRKLYGKIDEIEEKWRNNNFRISYQQARMGKKWRRKLEDNTLEEKLNMEEDERIGGSKIKELKKNCWFW